MNIGFYNHDHSASAAGLQFNSSVPCARGVTVEGGQGLINGYNLEPVTLGLTCRVASQHSINENNFGAKLLRKAIGGSSPHINKSLRNERSGPLQS
jgi:hypothetical protein